MSFFQNHNIILQNAFLKHQGGLTMGILDLIIIILIIAWLGGFTLHIAGGLIHILIVIAIILLVLRLLGKR